MAGGIEAEDDYNEQNDMMETDEEPFDMEIVRVSDILQEPSLTL